MRAYERLLAYVKYPTGSDESNPACPSNPKELDFGRALVEEMKALGITDAEMDEHAYVMGTIPASAAQASDSAGFGDGIDTNRNPATAPVLGLIAHMDTSPDAPNEHVQPRITHYEGGDLVLNDEVRIPASDLRKLEGKHLVTSDGTTLLGADNKAGIAEILTLAETLLAHPEIPHGKIRIAFTPDEEIGRSSDLFDIKKFGADFAYTVDGDFFGECQSETFTAVSAEVRVRGIGCHPGSAKGRMKDAIRIAEEFDGMLPADERPEYREGREGFYHMTDFHGYVEEATLSYILRDFEQCEIDRRKAVMESAANFLNTKYPGANVSVSFKNEYRNMREVLDEHPEVTEIPLAVLRDMGVEPDSSPIRGGTDGAFLSFRGLPCPNLGPGGSNFHSRMEFAIVEDMDRAVEMLVNITKRVGMLRK